MYHYVCADGIGNGNGDGDGDAGWGWGCASGFRIIYVTLSIRPIQENTSPGNTHTMIQKGWGTGIFAATASELF